MNEPAPDSELFQAVVGPFQALRQTSDQGLMRKRETRLSMLEALARFTIEREAAITEALHADLGRPAFEAYASEIAFVRQEARHAARHLKRWMRPRRVSTPLFTQPSHGLVAPEPLGVALVIGPWNYPLQLVLAPLVGAISAGCPALLKPSEFAPATSALLAAELARYLDPSQVAVVTGGVPETTALLALPFDLIFFTGGEQVGRIVMQAAARRLTPVVLELGGKSPCLVDRSADLDVAARRIIWGKTYNAGQTCVAPDYVLAHEAIVEPLVARLIEAIRGFFGPNPRQSPDFGRIVNHRHLDRLLGLIAGGGQIRHGGDHDRDNRYLAPTIILNPPPSSPIHTQEIFGPILPVIPVPAMTEAVAYVRQRPRPLALYLFANDPAVEELVLTQTSSGGVTINHTLLHLSAPDLPFGGVGASGFGAYHGRASFETFSHMKSILRKPTWFDPAFYYPPYTPGKVRAARRFL